MFGMGSGWLCHHAPMPSWLSTESDDLPCCPAPGRHLGGFAGGQLHATLRTWYLHHGARNACPKIFFGRLRLFHLHGHLSSADLRISCMQVIQLLRKVEMRRVMSETDDASATSDVLLTSSHAIGVRHLFFCKLLFLITVQLRIIPASGHL